MRSATENRSHHVVSKDGAKSLNAGAPDDALPEKLDADALESW